MTIFDGLSKATRRLVQQDFEPYSCPSGTVIFEQGDPAVFLYLILHGSVLTRYKPYDGPSMNLITIHAGDAFGWSAVIGAPQYTLGALAREDLQALRARGASLRALAAEHPKEGAELLDRLAQLVSNRWKDANAQARSILERALPHNTRKRK
ncbi:MAG: hypothetical protein HFACDABA_01144 [Anaerolineales bacterium]|nr:hypothetical protein [Anaerolineales bacterium]